jgi:hypothetical protein
VQVDRALTELTQAMSSSTNMQQHKQGAPGWLLVAGLWCGVVVSQLAATGQTTQLTASSCSLCLSCVCLMCHQQVAWHLLMCSGVSANPTWRAFPLCSCRPLLAVADPTAPEVLQADRLVAAAARKAVAMHRALEASRTMQQLPGAEHH